MTRNYFFTVSHIETEGEFTVIVKEKLFQTESRSFPANFYTREKDRLDRKKWRRELQLRYFPEHALLTDFESTSILQLTGGVEILFMLCSEEP